MAVRDPSDPTLLAYQVDDVKGDVRTLFERTRGVGDHGRRIENLEKAREEDRKEISTEISDLRRTIIQAMVSVFIAALAILAGLVQVVG
jgi:hypothetical protein